MPLFSKYHWSTTKDKPAATQSRVNDDCSSADLFTMPDHEFAELLWENGQIVMQGYSSRSKKSSFPTIFPSPAARVQEKDGSWDAGDPKASRFHAMDPMVDDFSPLGPTAHVGVNAQDDDMVPWINYPIIDQEPVPDDTNLQNDYCSGLILNEFPGVNLNSNSPSAYNNINPMAATERSSGLGGQDMIRNSHNMEHGHASKAIKESSEASRVRSSQYLFQSSQHCQSSAPNSKSRAIDAAAISDSTKTHSQNQNPTSPRPPQLINGGVLNFPHFSRPALLAKANNLQYGVVDRLRTNEKASALSNSINTVEYSSLIESASVFKSATGVQGRTASVPPKMELQSVVPVEPPREVISVEHPEAICQQDALKNNNLAVVLSNNCSKLPAQLASSSHVVASVSLRRRHEAAERAPEAVLVASSSSVCSANSAGAASNDPNQREKRKSREGEESGYQSTEDFEDVSVELRKPATGRGTSAKRNRAAEVHNLSERRRRDRINEKMRALQELIPNCNKADKASMLEEAIEYLKTLQMQIQIMSMSSGLCMPPMLLPPGMQPMHAPTMVRFSPMGVGMGMGVRFGYGMGMYDMHGSPPGCSMFPVPPPPPPPPQLPCPSSIPGPLGLHGMMPGPANRRMFGIPGQGVPLPMPRPSSFGSCSAGLSFKVDSVPGITAPTACLIPASDTAPPSISHDQQQQQSIDLESLRG